MAWQDWLHGVAGADADPASQVLRLIRQVRQSCGVNDAEALDCVVRYYTSGKRDDADRIRRALVEGALPQDEVDAQWDALARRVGERLPDKLRPIAAPVATLERTLTLPLIPIKAKGDIPTPGISLRWNVAGDEQLTVERALRARDVTDAGLSADGVALRLRIAGKLTVGIDGKVVPAWGTIDVKLGGGIDGRFEVELARAPSQVLLDALLDATDALPRPADLRSALQAAGGDEFVAAEIAVRGTLSAAGSISIGYRNEASLPGLGDDAEMPSLELNAAMAVSARVKRTAAYTVAIARTPDRAVRLRVEEDRALATSAALELGADVKVTGVADSVDAVIDELMPGDSRLWRRLAKAIDPVDLLGGEIGGAATEDGLALADTLSDGIDAEATAPAAIGAAPPETTAWELAKIVIAELPWVGDDPAKVARALVTRLAQRAGHDAVTLPPVLESSLRKAIERAQKRAQQLLAQWLQELQTAGARELQELLEPLARIDHDTDAAPTAAALARWIDAFAALRTRFADAVSAAAQAKLGIELAASATRGRDTASLFEATFAKPTASAEALYRAAWLGRFERLDALVRDAVRDGAVSDVKGSLVTSLTERFVAGISLHVLNASLVSRETRYAQLSIQSDLAGRVLVVGGKDRIEAVSSVWRERHAATVGLDAVLASRLSRRKRGATLDAAFSIRDERLGAAELEAFVRSLNAYGVLRSSSSSDLYDRLAGGGPRPPYLRDVALGVALALDAAEVERLVGLDQQHVFATAAATLYRFMRIKLRGQGLDAAIELLMTRAAERFHATDEVEILRRIGATYPTGRSFHDDVAPSTGGSLGGRLHGVANAIWYAAKQAAGIERAFAALRDAFEAAQVDADAASLEPKVQALMREIASTRGLAMSTEAAEAAFTLRNEMPWTTLGFYVTLGLLLDRSAPFGLVVEAVVPGAGSERTFLIA